MESKSIPIDIIPSPSLDIFKAVPPEISQVKFLISQEDLNQQQFQIVIALAKHFNSKVIIIPKEIRVDPLQLFESSMKLTFQDDQLKIEYKHLIMPVPPPSDDIQLPQDSSLSYSKRNKLLMNQLKKINPKFVHQILGIFQLTYLLNEPQDSIQITISKDFNHLIDEYLLDRQPKMKTDDKTIRKKTEKNIKTSQISFSNSVQVNFCFTNQIHLIKKKHLNEMEKHKDTEKTQLAENRDKLI